MNIQDCMRAIVRFVLVILVLAGGGKAWGDAASFTISGTYTWICPAGVERISVAVQGAGGGGGSGTYNVSGRSGGASAVGQAIINYLGSDYCNVLKSSVPKKDLCGWCIKRCDFQRSADFGKRSYRGES